MPLLFILGGPNGAGKTTSAKALLPDRLDVGEFINADAIAVGLSPFHPERMAVRAGRLMLTRLGELVAARESFVYESTLSTRSFAPFLRQCREAGYEIGVLFVWLDSPEIALERVENRVMSGGHRVPADDVRRRYHRSRRNLLELYLPLMDYWTVCNNSGNDRRVLARRVVGGEVEILDAEGWEKFTVGTSNEDR